MKTSNRLCNLSVPAVAKIRQAKRRGYLFFFSGDFAEGLAAGEAVFSAGFGLVVAAGSGEAAAGAVEAEGEGCGEADGTVSDCKTD